MRPLKIISGGQTGVDQAALRAAQRYGLPCGGWCPPRRESESGKIPSEFPLKETPQERSDDAKDTPRSQRTEWNVRDSDATLILKPPSLRNLDPGTDCTAIFASRYARPLFVCDPNDPLTPEKIEEWLAALHVQTLNVAGPSERTYPGIGEQAYGILTKVFEDVASGNGDLSKKEIKTEALPWWMGFLRLPVFGRMRRSIRGAHFSISVLVISTALIAVLYVLVRFFGFHVVAGQVYFGPTDQSLGAHVTVDATAGFQNSGIKVKKGQKLVLHPEGRIHTAMDHATNLSRTVKGIIVHNTPKKQFSDQLSKRYTMPPLDESVVFYRDWAGPEGEAVYSDLLEDCKLRKELNWGALLMVVIPSQASARADPYEVLKNNGLSASDLIPIPSEVTVTADRDGWLTFIVNEAVISPNSPSEDSQLYYDSLKRTAETLTGDPRHRIPLQSIPLIWFADNNGAFRVAVSYPSD